MKKFSLAIITLILFSAAAVAQTNVITTTHTVNLDKNTKVRDTSGMLYPFPVWQKMLASGEYSLRADDPASDSSSYVLVKMNALEKNYMMKNMKPTPSPFFVTGEKIGQFSAKDIKGNKIKLKDLEGKIVVLNFWFIACAPCRQEIPELNKIVFDYAKDPNVVFIAVGMDGRYDIKQFIKENPFGYQIIDDAHDIANSYGINSYPTNIVLDKEGKVLFHTTGYGGTTAYWIRKNYRGSRKIAGIVYTVNRST